MFKAGAVQTAGWYMESWLLVKHFYPEESPAAKRDAVQHSEAAWATEMLTQVVDLQDVGFTIYTAPKTLAVSTLKHSDCGPSQR